MAIFSLLFGASTVLMWQRNSKAGRKSTWLHYRRMFWLMLFGLAHAHLLWFGDILFLYSLCGMIVYWLCGLRPRWLIPLGLTFVAVASGISLLIGLSAPVSGPLPRKSLREREGSSGTVTNTNPAGAPGANIAVIIGGTTIQVPPGMTINFGPSS